MMKMIHFSPAQKWEVFEKQWEANCAPASHLFIDDQSVSTELHRIKKTAQEREPFDNTKLSGGQVLVSLRLWAGP